MTSITTSPPPLRVAMIGHAFMGAAHSHAWRNAHRFFDLPLRPVMQVVVGRDAGPRHRGRRTLRLGRVEHRLARGRRARRHRPVDICTPGNTHRDIAVAALAAGKHVLCEKPLANSVAEAEEMAAAAETALVRRRVRDVRLHLPAGAGAVAWPGSSWPRAGSARSGTSARSTCRTGCPTPTPR